MKNSASEGFGGDAGWPSRQPAWSMDAYYRSDFDWKEP